MRQINRLIVHHTASPKSTTLAQIRKWHLAKGFSDVGYHAVIYGDGSLRRGRSEEVVGAHAKGANTGTLGVALCGNFQKEEPSAAQVQKLIRVLAYWCSKYNVSTDNIFGHRQVGVTKTVCPGNNLFKHIPGLKAAIRVLLTSNVILGWPEAQ